MNTERESICCSEVEELVQLLDEIETESRPQCITQHTDFTNVCLCRAVLTVSLYSHRHRYGTSDVPTDENRFQGIISFDTSSFVFQQEISIFSIPPTSLVGLAILGQTQACGIAILCCFKGTLRISF